MSVNWIRPFAIAAAVLATVAGVAFATRGGGVAPAEASAHARRERHGAGAKQQGEAAGAKQVGNGHRHAVVGPAGPMGPAGPAGPPGLQGRPDRWAGRADGARWSNGGDRRGRDGRDRGAG